MAERVEISRSPKPTMNDRYLRISLKKCVAIRVSLPLSVDPAQAGGLAFGGSCRRPLCADRGFECSYGSQAGQAS